MMKDETIIDIYRNKIYNKRGKKTYKAIMNIDKHDNNNKILTRTFTQIARLKRHGDCLFCRPNKGENKRYYKKYGTRKPRRKQRCRDRI
jgi:biotin synthase-like enzyme